jgi:CheY-like chemotaxis protein
MDLLSRQAADLIERTRTEQQLRDADRRKDEFIAMLAHELRNPLVPIRTGIEMLKKAATEPEIIDTLRPIMERQIVHLVRMIDDLLDVSRITAGKIELKREPVSISSLVETAIEANRAALTAGNLDLTVDLEDPELILDVDATRLSQVISNLLQNAAKFTPSQGKIAVGAKLELDAAGDRVLVLKVLDSGIGIPAEMLPRVFDLFAQAESTIDKKQMGLGIGLALARRLIELHGGNIEARSDGPNSGSEFIIRLPAPNVDRAPDVEQKTANNVLQGLSVLVIDDNQDAADVMGMFLEDMGASTRVVYDGASGIAVLSEFLPSVALIDIGMPIMNGYETCRRIRAQHGFSISLIALTGWGQQQDQKTAAEAGFNAHLTKPADLDQVAQAILKLQAPSSRANG